MQLPLTTKAAGDWLGACQTMLQKGKTVQAAPAAFADSLDCLTSLIGLLLDSARPKSSEGLDWVSR